METTDIVIHKGEKDKKYQLYVEDYVMSYLKNYGHEDGRKIFFYGTREQKEKKYYIYGAGRQKNISYFVRYELLDEILCRFYMDMPVFSIKEESKRYELKGYYIFYQSNEAMQGYMVEQCKENESVEKEQDKFKTQSRGMSQFGNVTQSKIRPQDFSDIRARSGLKKSEEEQAEIDNSVTHNRTNVRNKDKESNKNKGGLLAFQLAAVFLVLAAIIINSTNSYSKLRELGQSAVEVFFAMENQEASQRVYEKGSDTPQESQEKDLSQTSEGTVLRLEDLDTELEKENQAAKEDETNENASEIENEVSEAENNSGNEDESGESKNNSGNGDDKNSSIENEVNEDKENDKNINASDNNESNTNDDKKTNSNKEGLNEDTNNSEGTDKTDDTNTETLQSQEAFARNLTEYYQIKKGDTLSNISIKKYGDASKVREICEINKIEDPDNIKYGQKIILP